jgi:hypothetical protein
MQLWIPTPGRRRESTAGFPFPTSRRAFVQWTGLSLFATAIACSDDNGSGVGPPPGGSIDLGTGDTAVLNYAYALEQLEAEFYTQVANAPFSGITPDEQAILTDIRDHEVVHRDFLKSALGSSAIPTLTFDLSTVNLNDRNSVLSAARTFEDLGVAAYNGAGRLLTNSDNLLNAGRIVSVEARHAAVIRELLDPGTDAFAGDVVDAQGRDRALPPSQVLSAAAPFFRQTISAGSLP